MVSLGEHEGDEVLQSKIEMRGVGGGLNPALEVDPVELRRRQRVRVVMDLEVKYVSYPPVKGAEEFVARNHVLTLVEGRVAVVNDPGLDRTIVGFLNERQEQVARLVHERDSEEAVAAHDPAQMAITDDSDLSPADDDEWEKSARAAS